jgi:hypothetical protein
MVEHARRQVSGLLKLHRRISVFSLLAQRESFLKRGIQFSTRVRRLAAVDAGASYRAGNQQNHKPRRKYGSGH